MNRPSNRWIAVGVTAVVALGAGITVLVGTGHKSDDDRMPPPLASRSADVQRLTVRAKGNPSNPTGDVKLADGTSVGIGVTHAAEDAGPDAAVLVFLVDAKQDKFSYKTVREGDTVTEFGARVKILKIWQMPNPDHDAMDVQADPAAG